MSRLPSQDAIKRVAENVATCHDEQEGDVDADGSEPAGEALERVQRLPASEDLVAVTREHTAEVREPGLRERIIRRQFRERLGVLEKRPAASDFDDGELRGGGARHERGGEHDQQAQVDGRSVHMV